MNSVLFVQNCSVADVEYTVTWLLGLCGYEHVC